jgi:uncharacterized delta-60 repeat protein
MLMPASFSRAGIIAGCVIGMLLSLAGSSAFGQAGAPDPGFEAQQLSPTSMTLQSDGKILLTGTFVQNGTSYYVMRENSDGSTDMSFFGSAESTASGAFNLTPSNGTVYLVQRADNQSDLFLERYIQSTGAFDTSFTPIDVSNLGYSQVLGLAGDSQFGALANGQILVVGTSVTRWNADGTQDMTFQSPTVDYTVAAPPTISPANISGAVLAAGGKIYIWGSFNSISGVAYNGIARLNADGSLDTTFVPAINSNTVVDTVYLEPSGSLLVSVNVAGSVLTLIRLESDGSVDPAFQSPQVEYAVFSYFNFTETPDQKILLWGTGLGSVNGVGGSGLEELNLDGSVVADFAADGPYLGTPFNVIVQPDGKLILAGIMQEPGQSSVPIIRLNADGTRDAGFDMVPESPIASTLSKYEAVQPLLQPDGKLLVHLTQIPLYTGGSGSITIGFQPPPPDLVVRLDAYGSYVPHTPAAPIVVSVSPQLTTVTWTAVPDVTGYQVQREEAGQWITKATVAANVTTYNDTAADGVTNFAYRIVAVNNVGPSIPSSSTSVALPGAFTLQAAPTPTPTEVDLSWTASSGTWNYRIYRAPGTVTSFTVNNGLPVLPLLATVSAGTTAYADTTVLPRQSYTYVIATQNVAGTDLINTSGFTVGGSPTSVIYVTTPSDVPPVSPARVAAAPAAPNTLEVVWESSPWATGYTVERSTNGVSGWQLVASLAAGAGSYADNSGLVSNQTYFYRITATDAVGASLASTVVSAYAPDANWVAPGALDPSFAPSRPIANVYRDELSSSGAIYYVYGYGNNSTGWGIVLPNGTSPGSQSDPYYITTSILGLIPEANNEALVSSFSSDSISQVSSSEVAWTTLTGARDYPFQSPVITGGSAHSLVALHEGQFLMTGNFTAVDGSASNGIARLNADGSLDATFSMTGIPSHGYGVAAVEQSNGSLIVNTDGMTLVRLLSNGLGNAGHVILNDIQRAVFVQPDDKILVGGSFTTVDDGSGPVPSSELVRLTADGKIDPAFSVGAGFVTSTTTQLLAGESVITYQTIATLAVDSAGRILVGGYLYNYDGISFNGGVVRLLPNGQFDPSFLLPAGFDGSNFLLSGDGLAFYAGSTLKRYFYGPTSSAAPANFSAWQTANSMSGTPTAMPRKDGVPNLLKYLFHVDPTRPMSASDRAALPTIGTTQIGATPYLTLTYRVNQAMTGLTVNAQTSSDLQTWTGAVPVVPMGTDPNTGDPIMQARAPLGGAMQFIRLDVSGP